MILKRKEKDSVIKAIYSSSNICASVYNNITNELTVIFNHGGQYKYADVAKQITCVLKLLIVKVLY